MAAEPDAECDYVVSARGPAAARSPPGSPRPACASFCSKPAAIRCTPTAAGCPKTTTCRHSTRFASENPAMRWDFFVRHYADDDAAAARPQVPRRKGILYPRAGTLGGCTAHNAMILVAPHDSDWDGIAALTGDPSWRAADMRRYCAAAGGLPLPRRCGAASPDTGSIRPDTAGTAGSTAKMRCRTRRCATTIWCGWCSARRAPPPCRPPTRCAACAR